MATGERELLALEVGRLTLECRYSPIQDDEAVAADWEAS